MIDHLRLLTMQDVSTQKETEPAVRQPKTQTYPPQPRAGEARQFSDRPEEIAETNHALGATITNHDERRAEPRGDESLRQREKAFRALVENLPDEISRFDREFRHLYINRRPERFMGKTLDESGFPEELVALWKTHFQRVFDTGRPDVMEYEATAENGSRRCFQSRLVPEFAPEGEVDSVLIVSRDITLRKQAEEAAEKAKAAAERADRAKSQFLLRVRQEMHELMNALREFAEIMKLENAASEQRENLEQILEGGRHLLDLINGMLDDSLTEATPR